MFKSIADFFWMSNNFDNHIMLVALFISIAGLIFYGRSELKKSSNFKVGRILYYLTTVILLFVSVRLMYFILNDNFSYTYIFFNSELSMNLAYKISAFWAGSEGSFLLWLIILNIVGLIVIRQNDKNEAILISVFFLVQIFFFFVVIINSPFQYLWDRYPAEVAPFSFIRDGQGMNELLQDPWMVIHPPILFVGFASAVIPFGYALIALLKKDYFSMVERGFKWVMFSSLTLGFGIFLGGYWSYKVLGWGGYWGWDPVENSSLVPWLIVVALLHGLIIQKRKQALIKTNIVLSMVYFVLVLYSTYLTRSGVLANFSVHSFGESHISSFLRLLWIFFLVLGFVVFILKYKNIESKKLDLKKSNWEFLTILGMIVITLYSTFIFFGTILPIISGLFLEFPLTVNIDTYYNKISFPLGILLVIFMYISTKTTIFLKKYLKKNILFLGISLVLGILFNIRYTYSPVAYIFATLSFFLVINYAIDLIKNNNKSKIAFRISHIGVGIMILGVISSGYHSNKIQSNLLLGEEKIVGDVALIFLGADNTTKKRKLKFSIKDGNSYRNFKTDYFLEPKMNSLYKEPHIERSLDGDYYITPVNYVEGHLQSGITSGVAKAGSSIILDNIEIFFENFQKHNSSSMMNGKMEVNANILINKQKYKVGMKMDSHNGETHWHSIPLIFGSEKRKLEIEKFDIEGQLVQFYLTPNEKTVIPKDRVRIEVSHKSLIWLVWLGTILISIGMTISLINNKDIE